MKISNQNDGLFFVVINTVPISLFSGPVQPVLRPRGIHLSAGGLPHPVRNGRPLRVQPGVLPWVGASNNSIILRVFDRWRFLVCFCDIFILQILKASKVFFYEFNNYVGIVYDF